MYLKCIKNVAVEETPVNYFTKGKTYDVLSSDSESDSFDAIPRIFYNVKDNFKQTCRIADYFGNHWFKQHFEVVETRPVVESVKTMNVWTNGIAIRKYTGQDKLHPPKKGWYKAEAVITRTEEVDV